MEWLTKAQITLRNKWAEALRSGRYKQCRGSMSHVERDRSMSYCVLGVAIETLKEAGKMEPYIGNSLGFMMFQFENYVAMNDTLGVSFARFADDIDAETVKRTPPEPITVAAPLTLPTEVIDAVYEADEKAIEEVIQSTEVVTCG